MSDFLAIGIRFFGTPLVLTCDGKCTKAWGINNRPKVQLSDDEDDYEFLADEELGEAPIDPGTYEGGEAKPTTPEQRLNKWCCRECERSHMIEFNVLIAGPPHDFSSRIKNKHEKKIC